MHVDVVDQLLPGLLEATDLAEDDLLPALRLAALLLLRLRLAGGQQGQHVGEGRGRRCRRWTHSGGGGARKITGGGTRSAGGGGNRGSGGLVVGGLDDGLEELHLV